VGGVRGPRWSVVIPAYNEASRLPSYLKEIQAYFEGRDESYEVIVVDDGSQDGTADRVREVAPMVAKAVVEEAKREGLARFSEETGTFSTVEVG